LTVQAPDNTRPLGEIIAEAVEAINPPADLREACRARIMAARDLLLRIQPDLEKWKKQPSPAEARDSLRAYADALKAVRIAAQGVPQSLPPEKFGAPLLASFLGDLKKHEEWALWLASTLAIHDGSQPPDLRKLAAVLVARDVLLSLGRPSVRRSVPGSDGHLVTLKNNKGWRSLAQLLFEMMTGKYEADLTRYHRQCDKSGYGGVYFLAGSKS
jgi:hypothetical protein